MPEKAGIYLHIPFCRSKCSYCAFSSWPCRRPPAGYPAALLAQARQLAELPWSQEKKFATLFVGGGTPTIYPAPVLTDLLAGLGKLFRLDPEAEISLEANPDTLTPELLRQLRRGGFNRISIGVQSFHDQLLHRIGRRHDGAKARQAVAWARQAGFANLNLDLMYGLPGQSRRQWRADIATALELQPEHLAIYQLTPEAETPLGRALAAGHLVLPEPDLSAELEQEARQALLAAGYQHYEVANYCRPGRACRHNLNYWHNGSYLGLGAAAVSCLDGLRLVNVAAPGRYRRLLAAGRAPYAEAELLGRPAAFRETVIMGLRLRQGLRVDQLQQRFALTPQQYYGPILDELIAQGLLVADRERIALSERGFALANQVLCRLV
ncbi:radical SAM family heme chaperone HemW [Desulfurivibrio alkaliphilus]|uniref:Heme chaperone HemW n=1 Tax=Desulfurivibrio alkaliphilus (strain DSM 19089 / UNIQEM U267 / AHT2) TaxID=589865 RepID=D6Z509_DESAT|nr:radical SAM family heme chaperone HemW [Desulfurivibrio alkaliphilus]ADH86634.1 oxygen-independent coproporphyrinogen III oxidase [Desulfurivibrio alkaliphilus AHT 2]